MTSQELRRLEHYLRMLLDERYSGVNPQDWRDIKLGDVFDKIYEAIGKI